MRFRVFIVLYIWANVLHAQNCVVSASSSPGTIVCGEQVYLSAYGNAVGSLLLFENFNTGTWGPGWSGLLPVLWNNPCSPGVDSTTHAWIGNTGLAPRGLIAPLVDASSCGVAGASICFDMKFSEQTGVSSGCEGPDEPDEGVYLQYSTDNGITWTTIHYFDPEGGYKPELINWNHWCFQLPVAAATDSLRLRWYQDQVSGNGYDHWGIDNVAISCNDPSFNIVWQHDGYTTGPGGGTDPNPVSPHVTTDYIVTMSNGVGVCKDTVRVIVQNNWNIISAGADVTICTGQSVQPRLYQHVNCGEHANCSGTRDSIMFGSLNSTLLNTTLFQSSGIKYQFIYRASELKTKGMLYSSIISELALFVGSGSGAQLQQFTIKMGCTDLSQFPIGVSDPDFIQGLQTVFTPKTIHTSFGRNNFVFDSVFTWDGVSNLAIEFCSPNGSQSSAVYTHSGGFAASNYVSGGGQYVCNSLTGTPGTSRPDTRFKYCFNSTSPGLTYSWSPASGVSNPAIEAPVFSPTVNTTYQVVANDPVSGCLFYDTMRIVVAPDFTITMPDDTVLCKPTVGLITTNTAGTGATYRWSPATLVSDSTIASPVARPLPPSTVYKLTVKSAAGCVKQDSVIVTPRVTYDYVGVPSSTICKGQTVQIHSGFQSCGTFGSQCSGVSDSVSFGTRTDSSSSEAITPFSGAQRSSRRQYLFSAAELNAMGITGGATFTKLAFTAYSIAGNPAYKGFTIKMGCTNQSNFAIYQIANPYPYSFISNMTTVFDPKTINVATGQNNFVLDHAYNWDGTSNLVVEVCYSNDTTSANSGVFYHYSTSGRAVYAAENIDMCQKGYGYAGWRPDTKFTYCLPLAPGLVPNWTPTTAISNTTINNPVVSAINSTTYHVTATDAATGCSFVDSVRVNVADTFSLYLPNDTFLCSYSGLHLVSLNTAGPGAIYRWTPGSLLNDSTISNPIANPSITTTYHLVVTSAQGCKAEDSVRVVVGQRFNFSVTPPVVNTCLGQPVHPEVYRALCGTNGTSCSGSTDSVWVGGAFASSPVVDATPFYGASKSLRGQILFTASELRGFGMVYGSTITEIAFWVGPSGGSGAFQNFTIKMGCSNLTQLSTTFQTGLQTVFTPKTINITLGLNSYVLDNAFDWDGVSNLIMEMCYLNPATVTSSGVAYNLDLPKSHIYSQSSTGSCNSTTGILNDYRPTTKFKYCFTPSAGLIYQWQPNAWISNSTVRNPEISPAASSTYWVVATDTVSGCRLADSVRINVGNNFSVSVPNDTILCSPGSISLAASSTAGNNATYQWTPVNTLSNSAIANPVASPRFSTTYRLKVTSAQGCAVEDSVKIAVPMLYDYQAFPDTAICIGQNIQAGINLPLICTTTGSQCSGTPDSAFISVGATGSSVIPDVSMFTGYAGSKRQLLFLASELAAMGMTQQSTISSIAFTVATLANTTNFDGFTIKMGCTGVVELKDTFLPALTTVFWPKIVTINLGQTNFVLDNPYNWDGVSNLVVEICHENIANNNSSAVNYHTTSFNSTTYFASNSNIVACDRVSGTRINKRPDTKFKYCFIPLPNLTYNWKPVNGGINNAAIRNPVLSPQGATNYTVISTEPVYGCSFADTIHVQAGPVFNLSLPNDTFWCTLPGFPLSPVTNAGAGAMYRWSPGTFVSDSAAANPLAIASSSTTYHLTVTSAAGCPVSDTIRVNIGGLYTFGTIEDTFLCLGQSVQATTYRSAPCGLTNISCAGPADEIIVGAASSVINGAGSIISPFIGSNLSGKRQYLFKASELAALGMNKGSILKGMAFQVSTTDGPIPYNNFTIKIGCTALSAVSTNFVSGLSTVLNPQTLIVTAGQNTFMFDSAYSWDGQSNLLVEICFWNLTGSATNALVFYHTTQFNSATAQFGSTNSCNTATGSVYTKRPTTTFYYCPMPSTGLIYHWTPVTGVSNANISNPIITPSAPTTYTVVAIDPVTGCRFTDTTRLHAGPVFSLQLPADTLICTPGPISLTNSNTAGTGAQYHWQPGNTLSDSTVANPTASPQVSTVYKLTVTSAAGCRMSDSMTINIPTWRGIIASPDTLVCEGRPVQARAIKNSLCGAWGSQCLNSDTVSVGLSNMAGNHYTVAIFSGVYQSVRRQYMFRASELRAVNLLQPVTFTELGFNMAPVSGDSAYQNFSVKMGCTNLTQLTTAPALVTPFVNGLQTVFTPKTVVAVTGWNNFTLDNTYNWDGVSNVIVEVCFYNPTAISSSSDCPVRHGYTSFPSSNFTYSNSPICDYPYGVSASTRPQTRFKYCFTSTPGETYVWSPVNDVSNPAISNPVLTPHVSTTYHVVASDPSTGCSYTDSVRINVAYNAIDVQGMPDTIICSAIGFRLGIINNLGYALRYTWQPANRLNNPLLATPTIVNEGPGQFIVTVTDSIGCGTRNDTVNILVRPAIPVAVSGDTTICKGDTVRLFVAGNGSPQWTPVTGLSNPNTPTPFASPLNSIVYQVTTVDSNGCHTSDSVAVHIDNSMQPHLGADTGICAGTQLKLFAGATGSSYLWTGNFTTPNITVATAGTYSVLVTSSLNCTASDTIAITIHPPPHVYLGNDTVLCTGHSLTLAPGNPALIYYWSTGQIGQTIGISTTGIYSVTAKDNNECFSSDTIAVGVNQVPQISLGNDTTLCAGQVLTLNAGNGAFTYHWSTGQSIQSIAVNSTGTYAVTATDNNGCSGNDAIAVTISSLPQISLGNDTMLCAGQVLTLNAGNGAFTYHWSTGQSIQSIAVNSTGTYAVTATDNNGCSGNDAIAVTVNSLPQISLGNDTTLCAGQVLTLNAGNGAFTYHWSTGQIIQSIAVNSTGTYAVTATDNNGCSGNDAIAVTINSLPQIFLGKDTSLCFGQGLMLNPGNGAFTYHWSTGQSIQSIAVNSTGTYGVTAADNIGCSAGDEIIVWIDDSIHIAVTPSHTTCGYNNGSAIAAVSGGAGSYHYLWSTNATGNGISNLPGGPYTISVTDSVGCSVNATVIVQSSTALPNMVVSADTNLICWNDSAYLCAPAGLYYYLWNTGASSRCIVVNSTSLYYVTVTDANNCSTESNHLAISVLPQPALVTSAIGDSLFASGAVSYQWYLNGSAIAGADADKWKALVSGTYFVAGTDSNGCSALSSSMVVTLLNMDDLQRQNLTVFPNPLGDGLWIVSASSDFIGETATLYDATGRKIYETTLTATKTELTINAARGVYLLCVGCRNSIITVKLVRL